MTYDPKTPETRDVPKDENRPPAGGRFSSFGTSRVSGVFGSYVIADPRVKGASKFGHSACRTSGSFPR